MAARRPRLLALGLVVFPAAVLLVLVLVVAAAPAAAARHRLLAAAAAEATTNANPSSGAGGFIPGGGGGGGDWPSGPPGGGGGDWPSGPPGGGGDWPSGPPGGDDDDKKKKHHGRHHHHHHGKHKKKKDKPAPAAPDCSQSHTKEACRGEEAAAAGCVWCQNKGSPFPGSDGVCLEKTKTHDMPPMIYKCDKPRRRNEGEEEGAEEEGGGAGVVPAKGAWRLRLSERLVGARGEEEEQAVESATY